MPMVYEGTQRGAGGDLGSADDCWRAHDGPPLAVPVVMGLWGAYVAVQGYTAYRGKAYTEEQIEGEMKQLP
jgi:hypothetical protein